MSNQPTTPDACGSAASQFGGNALERVDLEHLVEAYSAALYRYAYRLSGSSADAEDLTQQVFLVAAQKLDQVRNAECIRPWLYAVLRNCYLHERRRIDREGAGFLANDLDELPEQVQASEIDRELLQLAIDELPEEYKLVVVMFYFEDCTYREIAERLGLPIGTVMSRLSRGKGHLRGRLLARAEQEQTAATMSQHKRKRPIPWMT